MSFARTARNALGIALQGLVIPLIFCTNDAQGVILNWINPAGGNASTASNWSPAQIPAAADNLHFDIDGLYFVTFSSVVGSSSAMRFRDGTVNLVFNSDHTLNGPFIVADTAGDTTSVTLLTGIVTCNSSAVIGHTGGGQGTFRVDTDDAILSIPGTTNDLVVGNMGTDGFLTIDDGGAVEVGDEIFIGASTQGVGIVTVMDRSANLTPSILMTTNPTGDFYVGEDGYGELHVESFGQVFCSGDMYIAPRSFPFFDGNAVVTIGEGGANDANLFVDQDLNIAGGFGVAGGRAQVTIRSNGEVQVNGTTHLGRLAFELAELHITGGNLRTANLTVHQNSTLDFQSGSIVVDGGILDTDGEPLTINSASGGPVTGPVVNLIDGATATIPAVGGVSLFLGESGFGEARAENGGAWTLDGDVELGKLAGGLGVLRVTNGASITGPFTSIDAGIAGVGEIYVPNGILNVSSINVATNIGSDGLLSVSGPSASITCSSFRIGAGVAAAEPTTTLFLSSSASFDVTSVTGAVIIDNNGGMNIASNADFTTLGDILLDGEINLNIGTVHAETLFVNNFGGELSGKGTVTAKVQNSGVISPGLSAGKLAVQGNCVQTSTGKLIAELGNHATGEWDSLTVSGAATLAGTLEIKRLPTFAAQSGDVFTIMTFGSRTGTFTTVTLDGGPLTGFNLDYSATRVTLKALGATDAPADLLALSVLELTARRTAEGAMLQLALPQEAQVRLSVYDVAGRELQVLRDGMTVAGRYEYPMGAANLRAASGMYFARAIVSVPGQAPQVRTARVALIR